MNQIKIIHASVCTVAVLLSTVCAQEDVPVKTNAPVIATEASQPERAFWSLARVSNIKGVCDIYNPDVKKFMPANENKAYPLGSVVRTGIGSSVEIGFSELESVQLFEKTEVVCLQSEQNSKARIVRLIAGKIRTNLRENFKDGFFGIETANASCKSVTGRGEYLLTFDANAETFQVAVITGSNRVEGAHYQIPALRAANTLNVLTAIDRSLSRLTSVSGDFVIVLDKGSEEPVSYAMSPQAIIKIWRENAPVGGRAIISTLVVSPGGMAQHRFAYAEGRDNIATGELIVPVVEEVIADLPKLFVIDPKAKDVPVKQSQAKVENNKLPK